MKSQCLDAAKQHILLKKKTQKNKKQTIGFGENTRDLEGKQMQRQCQVTLIAESAVHVQEKTTGSRGARTFY